VRPSEHPTLDPFCVRLTGISQAQVDAAPPLAAALAAFEAWLGGLGVPLAGCVAVTWTSWDLQVRGGSWGGVVGGGWLFTGDLGWEGGRKARASWGKAARAASTPGPREERAAPACAPPAGCSRRQTPSPPSTPTPCAASQIQMAEECKWRGLRVPGWLCRWVDLKQAYTRHYKGAAKNLRGSVEAAGLAWEGRAHCGLDDARNEARLAVELMKRGVKFSVTAEFPADAPHRRGGGAATSAVAAAAGGSGSGGQAARRGPQQKLLKPLPAPTPAPTHKAGQWLGNCKCGVDAARRVTKKPGPNHGRAFFSCGNWRMIARQKPCDFFRWAEEGE
jgi:inhibitor of KinA sporulation pathway (predicted exonuclease)